MAANDTPAERAAYDLILGLRVGWLISRALHVAA
jgi:hypothetical protein